MTRPITQPVFWVGLSYFYGLAFWELQKSGFLSDFHLICLDNDPVIPVLRRRGLKIHSLKEEMGMAAAHLPRNTGHLLALPWVEALIEKESQGKKPAVVFFKPSAKIDFVLSQKDWLKVGNPVSLNKTWEDKVNFYRLAQQLKLPLPPGEVKIITAADFTLLAEKWGLPFLVQFPRGWAGKSSFLIRKAEDLEKVLGSEQRLARISSFLQGKTLINNACVLANGQIIVSPPGWQITGQNPLTTNPLATCGREWKNNVVRKTREEIYRITQKIGREMFSQGYRGFFGLDFLLSSEDKLYLLECNPRLTASFVFYHHLESQKNVFPLLACHLLSFISPQEKFSLPRRDDLKLEGGEMIQRNVLEKEIVFKSMPVAGLYSLTTKEHLKIEFFPSTNEEVGFIFSAAHRKVAPEDELFRMEIKEPLTVADGKIKSSFLALSRWALAEVWRKNSE